MSSNRSDMCFFALGDWGRNCPATNALAAAMNKYAEQSRGPDFILALGDNFYPHGVESVDDPLFKTAWADVFLSHKQLRVPWKVVLGNHDYMQNYQAEIDFTKHHSNEGGLWQCPAQNYNFTHTIGGNDEADPLIIDFFALDTNGCQGHVRRDHPETAKDLFRFKERLRRDLVASKADFKIVFAHHPIYTIGSNHGRIGRFLREDIYESEQGTSKGYGLEAVLMEGGVTAYFTGHEHCMQHRAAKGIHHFVCGAGGAEPPGFYGGTDPSARTTWADCVRPSVGFAAVVVTRDAMVVRFVSVEGQVLNEVVIPRQGAAGLPSVPAPARAARWSGPSRTPTAGADGSDTARAARWSGPSRTPTAGADGTERRRGKGGRRQQRTR